VGFSGTSGNASNLPPGEEHIHLQLYGPNGNLINPTSFMSKPCPKGVHNFQPPPQANVPKPGGGAGASAGLPGGPWGWAFGSSGFPWAPGRWDPFDLLRFMLGGPTGTVTVTQTICPPGVNCLGQ
jgi:hypothetical protein